MKLPLLGKIAGLIFMSSLVSAEPKSPLPRTEIRARQPFSFPVDPLFVTTMSDYDLSLLLFRTWFDYDDGRVAKPDLISSWSFDEKSGSYEFTVSDQAKWSNGQAITPEDLRVNLKRAVDNQTTYGQGIKEVIDLSSFTVISKNRFRIQTSDRKPKDAFFQRMGSIFLAISSPLDFPKLSGRLPSNQASAGPYMIAQATSDELELKRNPFFVGLDKSAPTSIRVRPLDPAFDLMKFLDEKTWENYIQLNTIIPPAAAKKLLSSGLPYWTRGYDRASLLRPIGEGKELARRREILKALACSFQNLEIPENDMKVRRADGLQPFGYPLFQKIRFPKVSPTPFSNSKITVSAPANYYGEFHRQFIERAAAQIGIKVEWKAIDLGQFYRESFHNDSSVTSNYDFRLMSFGVADPEPTTWMGLIFNSPKFISFDESDHAEFKKIAAAHSKEKEVTDYRALLEKVAARGGYLPLFHFSTLSIGHRNLNFKNIRELDETVNFAKVILE